MAEVISNTSPLQYLHQLGLTKPLRKLVGRLVVPRAVVQELEQGLNLGVSLPMVDHHPWMEVRAPAGSAVLPLVRDLGPGEASALALPLESPGSVVLLDDKLARRVAQSLGLPLRGTAGLLLDFKRRGLIQAVAPFLDELDKLNFRLSDRARRIILESAGEDTR